MQYSTTVAVQRVTRALLELLQALQEDGRQPEPRAVLLHLDEARRRFRLGSGPVVDCRRRPITWRLLLALVEHHETGPDRPMATEELVGVVWPDDRSSAASLHNRLYVALSRLKSLGLGEHLLRSGRGWSLGSEIVVARELAAA